MKTDAAAVFHARLDDAVVRIDRSLAALLPEPELDVSLQSEVATAAWQLWDLTRAALCAPGKRLRGFLFAEAARACSGEPEGLSAMVWRCAAAVEMIHCYSLIHDDLPAMDDSPLRRGRPTIHRRADEATAILAGDGLLTRAFAIFATPTGVPASLCCALIADLAEAIGFSGLLAGQAADLWPQRRLYSPEDVIVMNRLKTGRLITFCCQAGARLGLAGAATPPPGAQKALAAYGQALGLAFQITDDLLDDHGQEKDVGKPLGVDEKKGKVTLVTLWGRTEASRRAQDAIAQAQAALGPLGPQAQALRGLADYVLTREA